MRVCVICVCFEGNSPHGNDIFHFESLTTCMLTAELAGLHVKKWKAQCVTVVAVGLNLSWEKSRRDTQTNLLLNGWNAHTMCDVYNIIMYTTQPEETFDVNKYNHKIRRSVKVRFIFDYKTTTVVVKRRF